MSPERIPEANRPRVDAYHIKVLLNKFIVHDQETRELLRKQMEKGGITPLDIVTFHNRTTPWVFPATGLLVGALATPVWGRLIKYPPLTVGKIITISPFTAFIGAYIGTRLDKVSRLRTINSLEDPARFKKAIAEMKQEKHRAEWIKAHGTGPRPGVSAPRDRLQLTKEQDAGKFWQWRAQPASASLDVSQIEVDFGPIRIHDQATREILRKQVEKGSITHSDIATFESLGKHWKREIRDSMIESLINNLSSPNWFDLTILVVEGRYRLTTWKRTVKSLEDPPRFKQAVREMVQELEELKAASKLSPHH